tara:strand:+ start:1858 stop:2043 length:186 start_codon:yes stop_codon:yes gene_type:complete
MYTGNCSIGDKHSAANQPLNITLEDLYRDINGSVGVHTKIGFDDYYTIAVGKRYAAPLYIC